MIVLQCMLIHLIECLHDRAQINAAGPNAAYMWVKKWHRFDTIQWGVIYVLGVANGIHWFLLPASIIVRLFMLQVFLNKIRRLPLAHLGKNPVDTFFLRVFGRSTVLVKTLLLIAAFAFELIYIR